ncbi:hypothetical protein [Arthrobacter sp. U41]|uniref:hypothetical protein n=1 Tax=Arthrobacter sp. U41 TaxID=1849032 RepID=UPI000A7FE4D2|nr:hypothetical protein [Arthrobacter sp. U41]
MSRIGAIKRAVRKVVRGDATGSRPHTVATDVPFGAWFMAIFLDFFPDEGSRRAAARLVALGLVAAAPTGLSGWAEWARAAPSTQRVRAVLVIGGFLGGYLVSVRRP